MNSISFKNPDDLITNEEDSCNLFLLQQKYREQVEKLKKSSELKKISLESFVKRLRPLSGQLRGPAWETYCKVHYFEQKSGSKRSGDLYKEGKYYETKTALLSTNNNVVFRGNQIRLYEEDLTGFLFLTVHEDAESYVLLYIPFEELKECYINKAVSFSGSHIAGVQKIKLIVLKKDLRKNLVLH